MSKKVIAIVMFMVLSISTGVIWASVGNQQVSAEEKNDKNTIDVTGQGTIKVKPDTASVILGVTTENKEAKVAQDDNAKKMTAVIKALKAVGIKEEDIKTSGYTIYPRYNYIEKEGKQKIDKYQVTNRITVTVRAIDKVGKVIDIGVDNGVNLTNGVNFYVEDQEKYYQEALKDAFKNAKGKADALASVIGVKLDKPIKIQENSYGGSRINNTVYMEKSMNADVTTPIQPNEVEVTASVSVSYQY